MIQDGGLHGRADECRVQGGIRRIRQSESVTAWHLSVHRLSAVYWSNVSFWIFVYHPVFPSDSLLFKIILSISLAEGFFYIFMSIFLSVWISIHQSSVFLSAISQLSCRSVSLSGNHPVGLYLYPSVILSVCIFIQQLSCRFVSLSLSYPVSLYLYPATIL